MKRLLPLLLAASCATASSSRTAEQTASGFPTKESLKAITATPVPGADRSKYVDVETWALSGPFGGGDPLASRPAQQPWDALVDDAARARPNAQVNWSMHCAARELGRFHLKNGAHPAPSLQAFVLARCGTMVPYPR